MSEIVEEKVEEKTSDDIKFNPFASPVQERAYTKDMVAASIGDIPDNLVGVQIPEPTYDKPPIEDSPSESISATSEQKPSSGQSAQPISTPPSGGGGYSEPQPSANPDLADLPDKEKRKAAKKTADALITTYSKFAPMPFIKFASFNLSKLERMSRSGEIDLQMKIQEDGTTVDGYTKSVNEQASEAFTVTDEAKEEIKDPLVDVLMEQDMSLTHKQRLMFAVGGHVAQMFMVSMQMLMSNRSAVSQFKEFKANDDAAGLSSNPNRNPQPQEEGGQSEYSSPPQEETQQEAMEDEEDIPLTPTEDAYDSPTEEGDYDRPDMDAYMAGDIATVENGQLVIEED